VTAHRIGQAVRWLTGAGVLMFPACAALDSEPPAGVPPRARQAAPAIPSQAVRGRPPVDGPVRPAGGEAEVVPSNATPALPAVPAAGEQGKPLPINLPTALGLTNANPLDIQLAGERLLAANAALDRANVLWLPNLALGTDYFRHDGQIQDVAGNVFTTSKSSLLLGAGPNALFSVSDALYAPLAARQVVRARQAEAQVVRNDTTLQVAEAYFTVQQARGEVAGAIDTLRRAEDLVKLTESLAKGQVTPTVEVNRAKAEAARRRQAVEAAYERWQVASADLTRILRLEPGTLVEPAEEPALTVTLIDPAATTDELIPIALTYRPELAADQALIQAALARVRQETTRPYLPNVVVRGAGSQTPGLAGGYFGGGVNDFVGHFGARFSVDLQAVWEFQNLGLGNRAARREREAEQRQALLQLLRTQDLVTAEVVQAQARVRRAANRLKAAGDEVANAAETVEKNLKGLVPGKRGPGGELVLIFRPQEVVAAVTALDQAYRNYYAAVADYNRAQFQLYRAIGQPAQCLVEAPPSPATLPGTTVPAPAPTSPPSATTPAHAVPMWRPAAGYPQPFAPAPVPSAAAVSPASNPAEPGTEVAPPAVKPHRSPKPTESCGLGAGTGLSAVSGAWNAAGHDHELELIQPQSPSTLRGL
jgi:outer membrane protein TolC